MNDTDLQIILLVLSIIIAATSGGIWYKFKKFITSVRNLFNAIDKSLEDDKIDADEIKDITEKAGAVLDNGLGLWSRVISIFKR